MGDQDLQSLTLKAWMERTWIAYRRGVPLFGQDAILIKCMLHHTAWRRYWDSLVTGGADHDEAIQNAIVHIHNDVTVLGQIESGNPAEVKNLSDLLASKGFDEFSIVHTIGVALSEQTYSARERREEFSVARYAENAGVYAKELLARPDLKLKAKAKVY
jgi:hypothetical protein